MIDDNRYSAFHQYSYPLFYPMPPYHILSTVSPTVKFYMDMTYEDRVQIGVYGRPLLKKFLRENSCRINLSADQGRVLISGGPSANILPVVEAIHDHLLEPVDQVSPRSPQSPFFSLLQYNTARFETLFGRDAVNVTRIENETGTRIYPVAHAKEIEQLKITGPTEESVRQARREIKKLFCFSLEFQQFVPETRVYTGHFRDYIGSSPDVTLSVVRPKYSSDPSTIILTSGEESYHLLFDIRKHLLKLDSSSQ